MYMGLPSQQLNIEEGQRKEKGEEEEKGKRRKERSLSPRLAMVADR